MQMTPIENRLAEALPRKIGIIRDEKKNSIFRLSLFFDGGQ